MGATHSNESLRDSYRRVSHHKGKMAAYFVVVMAGVALVTLATPPEYRSESKLFVRLGRENVGLDPTTNMGQGGAVMSTPNSREDEINSVVEMLGSRVLLERLVNTFGPAAILGRSGAPPPATSVQKSPDGRPTQQEIDAARARWNGHQVQDVRPTVLHTAGGGVPFDTSTGLVVPDRWRLFGSESPRDQAIARMKKRLAVWAPKKSNVISVTYDAPSPGLAQAIVNRLVELYLDEHVRLNRTEGSRAFFTVQAQELLDRLTAAEERLRHLKDTTGITSVADQRRILVERIGRLEDQALSAESQLSVAEAQVQSLQARLATVPSMLETERSTGFANEAADGMRQQLYTLQLREQELLSKYTDDTPAVLKVQQQVKEARAILAREEAKRTQVKSGRNPAFEQLNVGYVTSQTSVATLRAQAEAVRSQLAAAKASLAGLNENEMLLSQAQRDVDLQDVKYRRYAETLEQTRVDQALELQRISNISVVQPATLEEQPVRPRKVVNLAIGLVLAVFGCVALGLLADYGKRSNQ